MGGNTELDLHSRYDAANVFLGNGNHQAQMRDLLNHQQGGVGVGPDQGPGVNRAVSHHSTKESCDELRTVIVK